MERIRTEDGRIKNKERKKEERYSRHEEEDNSENVCEREREREREAHPRSTRNGTAMEGGAGERKR